jgi:hypothetical protein
MSVRDDILRSGAAPTGEASVLGHTVKVRGLTAGDTVALFNGRKLSELMAPVCATGIIDDDGKAMFTEAEILATRTGAFKEAFMAILDLSGYGDEGGEEEKNS